MNDLRLKADLEAIKRSDLIDSRGVTYAEFRRTLTPKYAVVWFHVLCGYLGLGAGAGAIRFAGEQVSGVGLPIVVVVGAAAIGYIIHYLHLFMHEAAHYNLANDRRRNDRLANVFIGVLVGMHIKPYRPTHFDHHRYLGTPRDTEISYFDPLNIRFIVESLLGLRVFKTIVNRNKSHSVEGIGQNKHERALAYRAMVVSAGVHLAIVAVAAATGSYVLAAAWGMGAYAFYPFFGSLRTLLEHRDEHADKTVDYTKVNHGRTNRLFGIGPLATTFGNAGFNRHLLHHWDPQVSYTRLKDLEAFLMDTEAARTILTQHRTTYLETFVKLYNR